MAEITELIGLARDGDRHASERLFAALYAELKRVARGQLAGGDAPLHATSLVHEAYMKLARGAEVAVRDREHFYAIAARVMRQIIIDHVRARDAQRRGAGVRPEALDSHAFAVAAEERGDDVLALDAALESLAAMDPALARLVELRFYAGLELDEIAALVGRSERSLKRDWRRARAYLYAEVGDAAGARIAPADGPADDHPA
ncbi:ECF-type sigma factor [Dokdonella sp. MW10]|uniref:ECF-type sigma factor n=1 Tax=Dokdonella sp. MW10 TaxID=2992926 RepID=UPI003F7F5342